VRARDELIPDSQISDELIPDSQRSDELIPNGSVEPVPIDKSCRLYSIWHAFELIPNGRVGLVQPPHLHP
jgi:hypothetical protein